MAAADESYVEGQNGSFVSYMIDIVEKWTGLEILEGSLHYLDYLLWVFTPLIIVFILPLFIILFLYLSILFLHMYKRKRELQEAYSNNVWDGARKTLATLWDGHATIWHGYEIHGLEKIPDVGPALIVYYHGAIPVDYYYFLAKVILQKGRTCHSVADHFLFKLPGFKLLLEVFSVMHGPQEECVKALKGGHLLAISPGGVREALFSDETYSIFWRGRKGFAQVAIDAQVNKEMYSTRTGPSALQARADHAARLNYNLLRFLGPYPSILILFMYLSRCPLNVTIVPASTTSSGSEFQAPTTLCLKKKNLPLTSTLNLAPHTLNLCPLLIDPSTPGKSL
ncbi:DGAT1/2-independent enzyme synthesizing storage lipids isoform X1 [Scyliorhinus torazame]|uniref:DGAT1/2-independent enzyme synthesizing storage lipids isoform X1 n=1 Tax=Scyliorhinus torazame TaxID=75743 RepID=UPI003B5A3B90